MTACIALPTPSKSRSLPRQIYLGLIVLAAVLFAPFAAYSSADNEITVAAAISLKKSFIELAKIYETNYATHVNFNFGASGDLALQIIGGAPVDVFASAAQQDMDLIERKGLLRAGSRSNFASNRIVLIAPQGAKTGLSSFGGLSANTIKLLAIGNPKSVPAGRYAMQVLDYYQLYTVVADKLIYAGNVRQVLDYVARGEVDAGLVYASDVATLNAPIDVLATAPAASHAPVIYPIAIINGTQQQRAAARFVSLVLSTEAKQILAKYGFAARD
ncbi:MAG: molybdate ABC transporter substrate-binding protein [Gammaproteobacteria bacterium]|nr:molybdate ABC transporter substrate-binding protein [Gammaproteobacteria bacterium]